MLSGKPGGAYRENFHILYLLLYRQAERQNPAPNQKRGDRSLRFKDVITDRICAQSGADEGGFAPS